MIRNMDMVRVILLKIEDEHNGKHPLCIKQIEDYDSTSIIYHMDMLSQAGFIRDYEGTDQNLEHSYAADEWIDKGLLVTVDGLTWEGHDFLEKIRDISAWGKIKKAITDKGLPLTVDVIKEVAKVLISQGIKSLI